MKFCMMAGLLCSIIGTALTGLLSQGGVSKKGDYIKAPNRNLAFIGWILILVGFIIQFIITLCGE